MVHSFQDAPLSLISAVVSTAAASPHRQNPAAIKLYAAPRLGLMPHRRRGRSKGMQEKE